MAHGIPSDFFEMPEAWRHVKRPSPVCPDEPPTKECLWCDVGQCEYYKLAHSEAWFNRLAYGNHGLSISAKRDGK